MSDPVTLVTGAGGEMGHSILNELHRRGERIVALDVVELPETLRALCAETVQASVLDRETLEKLIGRHRPRRVYHLAAVLSRKAEADPDLAHRVNVEGSYILFDLLRRAGDAVRFLFPSSIAVYGLPDAESKKRAGAVREDEWLRPVGIYGCNKLYCELLGTYFSRRADEAGEPGLDFRAIRFPGLISADTLPSGGTTDYAPEMIHAAARERPYRCFVAEDTRLPFMTMPDAARALLALADAPGESLSRRVYNIRGFSPSAGEIRREVLAHFPNADITFEPRPERQAIVDSWPEDVDDGTARRDWGLAPRHGLEEALRDYLVPALRRRYAPETVREGGVPGGR